MATDSPRILHTPQETAGLLNMSVRTIYELAAAGKIRKRYDPDGGRRWWVHIDDIRAYADSMPGEPKETQS